jgi:hypothetical protein
LLAVFVFRRFLSVEITTFSGLGVFHLPPALPERAADWFTLLQADPLLGLALLDIFDLLEYVLLGLVFLALSAALWRLHRSLVLVAAACGMGGILLSFATNSAFAMLSLSHQAALAPGEAQRAAYLFAGEALLANHNSGGLYTGLFFVLLGGLLFSIAMLSGEVFSKAAAWSGMLANGFGLAYYVFLVFAPGLVVLPFPISAPFRMIWYLLVAIRLFKWDKK